MFNMGKHLVNSSDERQDEKEDRHKVRCLHISTFLIHAWPLGCTVRISHIVRCVLVSDAAEEFGYGVPRPSDVLSSGSSDERVGEGLYSRLD